MSAQIAMLRNVMPGTTVVMTVAQLENKPEKTGTKTVTVTEQYPAQNRTRVRVDGRMKTVDGSNLIEFT